MKTLINFGKNIFLSNFKRLDKPYKLTFTLTYQCNSRCKICQIWKRKVENEFSLDQIEHFFTTNNFFNWIDLTGGEVFLREDLIQVIKTILKTQRNLYLLHIPTNGILTGKIISDTRQILNLGPNRFLVSIAMDGPAKLHNQLRGIKDNWQRAVATYKNLKQLKAKNLDCYFGMTLSGRNYHLIEETYQELKKEIPNLDRNDLHFNIAHYSSHYYQNLSVDLGLRQNIGNELKKFNKQKRVAFSRVYYLEKRYQDLIPKYLETGKTPLPCRALSASVFIDPRGDIYPCGMWEKKLGSLKDFNFDLKKLWQEKMTKEAVKVIKTNKCPSCWTPCEAYQSILGSFL